MGNSVGRRFLAALPVMLLLFWSLVPSAQAARVGADGQTTQGSVADVICSNSILPCLRPDARIRRSGGPLIGNDVYDNTFSQSVSITMDAGDVRRIYISIENDGALGDNYSVCSTNLGTHGSGVDIRYFKGHSNKEISDYMPTPLSGRCAFTTGTMVPGEKYVIRARVSINDTATSGQPIGVGIVVTSLSDENNVDTVAIWAQRN